MLPKLKILRSLLVGAVTLSLTTTSFTTLAADKVYRLKLAETWGPNTPILGDATKNMAKLAEEMSNGRLKIRIDSANKHKAPLGIFDMVKSGQYDLGHSSSYYWKGKVPNTLYFSSMPFGMISTEQYAWFYRGGGMELMEKVYAPHNLLSFPGGNSDIQMGGWFKKEINSVEDLKGLKIRIPGFAGEVMAKVGAKPTNIAPGELYTSLERGTIDALEWVGPAFDLRMGFQKIAPYYYTAWHEPGSETQFLVNKKKWDSLPKDLQTILETAFRVSAFDMYTQAVDANANSWATMSAEYPDIKVRDFPPEVLKAMQTATTELLKEQASSDALAKEIINSQKQYLTKVRAWTEISSKAYLDTN
ncbi:TRAP-type mannitol/chloroaromatic compound transport system, periplasmic component [Vibrio sinaloensis DSM 21326]|uniref:TRAP-type mannitol/chloroaromatic compound transport system, periplasmic component n=1 Tax=Vibrio sinaloensis DSM 21326 TaxID=945550 RepID=E8M1V5_PHOS4|nr:TRAP transporter substrate-binding protein [Vibrio sinaloensis]EGA71969.1 TRAP-type mannitol/chloroaromatic compound transport system, periplasmic component [Vibrio sinaloensis DSM 21326]